jgi:hypothetical protein
VGGRPLDMGCILSRLSLRERRDLRGRRRYVCASWVSSCDSRMAVRPRRFRVSVGVGRRMWRACGSHTSASVSGSEGVVHLFRHAFSAAVGPAYAPCAALGVPLETRGVVKSGGKGW